VYLLMMAQLIADDNSLLYRSTSRDRSIPIATFVAARLGDEEDLNVMKSSVFF
jgi:hypothetical protein